MKLNIISPEKTLFSGNVESVTLPGVMGSFTILDKHAPIISALQKGVLSFHCTDKSKDLELPIDGGFIESKNNIVTVCID